jgi:hypothetical protein
MSCIQRFTKPSQKMKTMNKILALFMLITQQAHAQDAAIGDSIAFGVGQALHVPTQAWVGASSCYVLHHVTHEFYRYVVVSAGINDPPGPCVRELLRSIVAQRIVVILPAPINSARANVARQAIARGADTIAYDCRGGCNAHNFHPGSYAVLAQRVREIWSTP